MKNSIYFTSLILIISITSCQKLDREFQTDLTKDQIEVSYSRTQSLLNAVYQELQEGFNNVDGAMMASTTDEAEHRNPASRVHLFNTGSLNATNNPDNAWGGYFRGIRKANFFLEFNTNNINLERLRLDPNFKAAYAQNYSDIIRWKYEARFLRAFFYFELVKRYGGVPIFTKPIDVAEIPNVKRNTLAECIKFIVDECDSVNLARIPDPTDVNKTTSVKLEYPSGSSDDSFVGRATRGAALALKSRVLLYAASDLFNTPSWAAGYANPELISFEDVSPAARTKRWQEAADAAWEVIREYNISTLTTTYDALFNATNHQQREVIFARRNAPSNSFEVNNFPIGFANSNGLTNPSQNLVDAYEIREADGTSIKAAAFDWAKSAHVSNIYNTLSTATANSRDPRLTFTIGVHNRQISTASGFNRNIDISNAGTDGPPKPTATRTGYYIKKYINATTSTSTLHSWVYFRLADIFLNYAEAKNELGDVATAATYVNKVRARTGVNMPEISSTLTKDEMKNRIIQERRVELAFEDHRAWDVRRWMIAGDVLKGTLYGVSIAKVGTALTPFTSTKIEVETRDFNTRMYLYPIPQGDLSNSKGLIQNPGYF